MSTRSVRSRLHIRSELLCAALILTLGAADAHSQQLGGLPDLIEVVAPSVVTIGASSTDKKVDDEKVFEGDAKKNAKLKEFFEKFSKGQSDEKCPYVWRFCWTGGKGKDGNEAKKAQGDGIVLSSDGYIVTVSHQFKDAHDFTVTLEEFHRSPSEGGRVLMSAPTSVF